LKIKINKKVVEIRVGDRVHGFPTDVPGYWEIKSIRPFRVIAYHKGKHWRINVSRKEFAEKRINRVNDYLRPPQKKNTPLFFEFD